MVTIKQKKNLIYDSNLITLLKKYSKIIVFIAYEIFVVIMCYIYVLNTDLILAIALPLIVTVTLIYILTSDHTK